MISLAYIHKANLLQMLLLHLQKVFTESFLMYHLFVVGLVVVTGVCTGFNAGFSCSVAQGGAGSEYPVRDVRAVGTDQKWESEQRQQLDSSQSH